MNKIFLYLYPIKEYIDMFLYSDVLYEKLDIKSPLPILNECVQRRYRENGFQIIYVLYPDKELYGLDFKDGDKIIYTDILFSDFRNNIKDKDNPSLKYPNEKLIIESLGNVHKLVIGGYHYSDCVKRIGEMSIRFGIDTLIDLDLTDLFFTLYRNPLYFKIEEYNPERFKEYIMSELSQINPSFAEKHFKSMYSSEAYGFKNSLKKL